MKKNTAPKTPPPDAEPLEAAHVVPDSDRVRRDPLLRVARLHVMQGIWQHHLEQDSNANGSHNLTALKSNS